LQKKCTGQQSKAKVKPLGSIQKDSKLSKKGEKGKDGKKKDVKGKDAKGKDVKKKDAKGKDAKGGGGKKKMKMGFGSFKKMGKGKGDDLDEEDLETLSYKKLEKMIVENHPCDPNTG